MRVQPNALYRQANQRIGGGVRAERRQFYHQPGALILETLVPCPCGAGTQIEPVRPGALGAAISEKYNLEPVSNWGSVRGQCQQVRASWARCQPVFLSPHLSQTLSETARLPVTPLWQALHWKWDKRN